MLDKLKSLRQKAKNLMIINHKFDKDLLMTFDEEDSSKINKLPHLRGEVQQIRQACKISLSRDREIPRVCSWKLQQQLQTYR